MSDYPIAGSDYSLNRTEKQQSPNLAIPEAAMDLGVSETRLRKTLAEGQFVTEIEFRQTRTGVRKTAMLPPATIEALQRHYRALEQTGAPAPVVPPSAWLYPPADNPADTDSEEDYASSRRVRESAEEAAYLEEKMKQKNRLPEEVPAAPSLHAAEPSAGSGMGVPLSQFNALLYQHNVLREDLTRMNQYLADCDHLLEEMIKTIVTLEARMQSLERNRPNERSSMLTSALRSVSQGFAGAFAARKPASRPALKPSEVYYANVLSRS